MDSNTPDTIDLTPSQALIRDQNSQTRSMLNSNLSYAWATNDSVYSNNFNHWIGTDTAFSNNTSMEQRRLESQGSRLPSPLSFCSTLYCYLVVFLLPLFNLGGFRNWRCAPSSIFNSLELMISQVSGLCGRLRTRLRRYTREEATRDLFAGAMDVILVVYAIGFLLLSMYQASMFQQF